MDRTKQKSYTIEIEVLGGKIDLGEKYAIAAYTDSTITWTYNGPFAVQFEPDTPFQVVKNGDSATVTIPREARLYHPYKYTIAVDANKEVLILDPLVVRIPPRG